MSTELHFKSMLIALASLLLANCLASAQPLKVMTWNIRYDNRGDGVNAWTHRKDWVVEIIIREKADVAGFQEVLAGQFKDLKERLPEMESYGVGRDDGKAAGELVPIFYRKTRFELLDKGTFWLSPTPDKPGSKGWDASITRICSWVKLKDKESAAVFYLLNAHFDHQGREARLKSAEMIVSRLREQLADHPAIFLGDLNTGPDSGPYKVLVSQGDSDRSLLRDAYQHSATKPAGPDSTWNGFQKIAPGNRIDYLFGTAAISFQSLKTLTDQREGKFPSDHLPVIGGVEIMR